MGAHIGSPSVKAIQQAHVSFSEHFSSSQYVLCVLGTKAVVVNKTPSNVKPKKSMTNLHFKFNEIGY